MLHRLGMLNVFDPMDPDREYKMDLRRWDHREMCKILVLLEAHEPGDNWVGGGEFRWSKYDEPVPGWMLPAKWAAKDESEAAPRTMDHAGMAGVESSTRLPATAVLPT